MASDDIDITKNQHRFRFNMEAFVLGRQVTAIIVNRDRVELQLGNDRAIAFKVNGLDIVIEVSVPDSAACPTLDDAPASGRIS